jgi:hypothetical protein
MNAAKREYRIRNAEVIRAEEILHHSIFVVRYSFRAHGKFLILDLPAAGGLANTYKESGIEAYASIPEMVAYQ